MVLTEKLKYTIILLLGAVCVTGYWMYGFKDESVYVRVGGFIAAHGFSVGTFWHMVNRLKALGKI